MEGAFIGSRYRNRKEPRMKVSAKLKIKILKLFKEDGKTIAEISLIVCKPIPVVSTIIHKEVF